MVQTTGPSEGIGSRAACIKAISFSSCAEAASSRSLRLRSLWVSWSSTASPTCTHGDVRRHVYSSGDNSARGLYCCNDLLLVLGHRRLQPFIFCLECSIAPLQCGVDPLQSLDRAPMIPGHLASVAPRLISDYSFHAAYRPLHSSRDPDDLFATRCQ